MEDKRNMLRTFIKNTRAKRLKIESDVNKDLMTNENRCDFINEMEKIITEVSNDKTKFHKKLKIFRDPFIRTVRELNEFKEKYKDDPQLVSTISKSLNQIDEGARILNAMYLQLEKEKEGTIFINNKLEKLNEEINDFVNDILTDLNDVSKDLRKEEKM